ncbi:hypothetical protein [Pseudoalteromonas sp. A757]|uniref:hypothetical protein n=1 Tax=Pseudoalteromonas sp. A757 TaxID=2250709 RepID=UPI000FFED957|nr:hypothetical protein [Pseudoalteromonas sp. A757]RXE84604.1 hypothetical protein DRB05_22060 [Pseudoalteromonas sp. A757]
MKKSSMILAYLLVSMLALVANANELQPPHNQPWNSQKPWLIPQDTNTALNQPDHYAWQLFVALNWPANTDKCKADKNSQLGEPGSTVWEVWQSREETFLDGAARPLSWKKGCLAGGFDTLPTGDYTVFADESIRFNRIAYRYIRQHKLYSLDEQERLARSGITDLKFPLGSVTAKAHWVRIDEIDKPRYHWREVTRDGVTHLYGMSGFHIVSKDSPTWFWATFEHIDNERRWPQIYPEAFSGWLTPSVDHAACSETSPSCNEYPRGYGLSGTKWENYRLRGTQTQWTNNRGVPTTLANSQLESFMDLETSSCITCHALAVKGEQGPSKPISFLLEQTNIHGKKLGYVGPPQTELFLDGNGETIPYLGLDYVWALRKAKREQQ